jgi:hypothetical protein
VDVDSIVDVDFVVDRVDREQIARTPTRRTRRKVEVNDGLNVDGHVNVNDSRQGQSQGQGQGRRLDAHDQSTIENL